MEVTNEDIRVLSEVLKRALSEHRKIDSADCFKERNMDAFGSFVSMECADRRLEALRMLWKTKKPTLAQLVLDLPTDLGD